MRSFTEGPRLSAAGNKESIMSIANIVRGFGNRVLGFYPQGLTTRVLAPAALAMGSSSCQLLSDFNTFTPQQDIQMGDQAYGEILSGESTVGSGAQYNQVMRVTQNLVNAAHEVSPQLAGLFEWQVTLIDSPGTVNAFCLPGGKMAVYTGILPVAQSDAGLAVVMGHEIAHALERHGTSAVSKQMVLQYGSVIVAGAILGGEGTDDQLAEMAILAATTLTTLSFGRDAEYEADQVGLEIMARAGYDPREAVGFWQRMDSLGSAGGPEWLSTHPSNANRIRQIQESLPRVLPLYEAAR
jgi:metalloendopeptidase OMA1, mitochondrial